LRAGGRRQEPNITANKRSVTGALIYEYTGSNMVCPARRVGGNRQAAGKAEEEKK